LKARGFAESSFEAIAQANQIYGDDEVSHEVKHGLINNSDHDRITKNSEVVSMANDEVDKKLKKFQDDINVLTEKMNEIIKALNDMDTRITQIKNKPEHVERVIEKSTPKIEVAAEASVEHHEQPKQDEYTNQRVGNFQSQDVAIDKMFYYGNKK
jgi:uncharacterized protein YoxC